VEDMGISIPMIYAALDNKEDDFQSQYIIEVEGKINNQLIEIVINIDPKLVESFIYKEVSM
jgi:hypothetical protein